MTTEPARVLRSLSPLTYDTVPRDRVPPGYTLVHLHDRGTFFADMSKFRLSSSVKHGPFPDAARGELRRFQRVFAGAYTRTLEGWEDGFRRDRTPWREMAIWDVWAAAVERFTAHVTGDDARARARRADVARVVLVLGNSPPAGNVRFRRVGTVSAARVREINAYLSGPAKQNLRAALEKYRRVLRPVVLAAPFPDEVSIHALIDDQGDFNLSAPFDAPEFLGAADLVYAKDVGTGARVLVYGRDLAARTVAGEQVEAHRAATVLLDAGSGEFELLCAALVYLKGRHEYSEET